MAPTATEWFCQRDLTDYFAQEVVDRRWLVVEEHFRSTQRKIDRWLLPIPVRKFGHVLEDPDYADLFDASKRRIQLRRDVPFRFLTPTFCQTTGISNRNGDYRDTSGRVAAKLVVEQRETYFSHRLVVRGDILGMFFESTAQVGVAAVDSLLFSERALEEFGLTPLQREIVSGDHYCYSRHWRPSAEKYDPRAWLQSTSHVWGKKVLRGE